MPRRRKGLVPLGFVAVAALVAGACANGEDDPDLATPADEETTSTTAPADASETTEPGAADEATSLVAQAREDSIGVWSSPSEVEQPARTIRSSDETSSQVVMLVKQELGPDWIEVYLPTAPAGDTGWIRRADVELSRHRFRIEVALGAHTLTVFAGNVAAVETPVAVGPDVPTAAAGLFIKDLIEAPDPGGQYGRYAYGLSGSYNGVEDFEAGTGVVGIHGTPDTGTLGTDAPSGSLAIGGDELDRLVGSIGLPLGTPVTIVP
jgi:hypothetical protein